jgi:hypothetical protein
LAKAKISLSASRVPSISKTTNLVAIEKPPKYAFYHNIKALG